MTLTRTSPSNAIACFERPVRATHLPPGLQLDVGATYQHALGIGSAAVRLSEAQLSGSASLMQMAAREIAELAQKAQATATRIEHQLARHRRRISECGVRS